MSKKFIKGQHGRSHKSHVPFREGNDGTKENVLEEPIPKFFARPGDGVITASGFDPGIDNNTMIVFGRDRTGEGEIDAPYWSKDSKSNSGYSDHMAAGAIDIVVGRVSPFPVNVIGKSWGPLFKTKRNLKALSLETLDGSEAGQSFFTSHPGYAMDAARIYISQMTDIDHNFDVQRALFKKTSTKESDARTPCSSIMIKSDKVRVHARQDIKIVTGGSEERENSQGAEITEIGGIHLIAGNKPREQQPIPRGDNLAAALAELSFKVDQLAGVLYSLNDSQMKYNDVLSTHWHHSPFYGQPTVASMAALPVGVATVLDQFAKVSTQLEFLKTNIDTFKGKYLKPGAKNYINSKYNTTN